MRIWPLYITFLTSHSIPESTIRIYRRFVKFYNVTVWVLKIFESQSTCQRRICRLSHNDWPVGWSCSAVGCFSQWGQTCQWEWQNYSSGLWFCLSYRFFLLFFLLFSRLQFLRLCLLLFWFCCHCCRFFWWCIYFFQHFFKIEIYFQLWSELCELISKNPTKVHSLNVDAIMRQGINKYSDQVGILWCALAEYYIRAGQFEKVLLLFIFIFLFITLLFIILLQLF